ncbi:hypothetical protein [Blastococcus saxobsidens]|uniref:Uncharacterized protein (TIGR02588 family) n=1 Tax=Blastococcus saxobsidens TaxID=138336 RepID=A0A4V2G1Z1_9ACTN|nr:hypothetical protein [Blastococcus saxobsidens]RZU31066.1 uncharacterized protein (TIGR02588 family) [Blastococcus saxobsidens]
MDEDQHADTSQDGQQQDDSGERTTPGEYVLGALGGLVVLLLLGFLTYQAVAVRESDPALSVSVTSIEAAGDGYAVHFELRNSGGRTAEQVQISGTLTRDGAEVGQASTSIPYLPPNSRHSGALLFSEDPRDGRLQVRPAGFVTP